MTQTTKPFSKSFVIGLTGRVMLKAINKSIGMTVERIEEFADNQEKSREVFETLAHLQALKQNVEQIKG